MASNPHAARWRLQLLTCTTVLLALAATGTTLPATAGARARPVTVASGDGLRMTLSPRGAVTSLEVGRREIAGPASAPLFSVRRVGGTPNLLPNPGLEADADSDGEPDGWQLMSGDVSPEWVGDEAHSGRRSVRFSIPTTATSSAARTTVPVERDTFYRLDGWVRSRGVRPTAATAEPATGASPVRLKVQQFSGTTLVDTSQAYGYTDTAGWHRRYVGFRTGPDVTSVRVLAQVVNGSGTVWFDDLALRELFRPGWERGDARVRRTARGAAYQGAASGIAIDATVTGRSDHLRIEGVASSRKDRETPFQLRLTLPVAASGWRWWDDPRRSRRIEAGERYHHLTRWNLQQASRYPFSTVSDPTSALTVGTPLNRPRLARTEYGGGRLQVTFDLGVSPRTSVLGGAGVPFSLVLYRSGADWGYRSAIAKWYRIFPGHFERRTEAAHEGGWVGRFDLDELEQRWADFGFGLNMIALHTGNDGGDSVWGTDYLPWDDARGIYATAYNHHWGYKHPNVDDPVTPSYRTEIGRLRAEAAIQPTSFAERRTRDRAAATLNSGARDNNGRRLYARYHGFLQHYENLNPLRNRIDWRTASRLYQMRPAVAEAAEVGGTLDGLHLDSVSGMRRWGEADDYHRPHWRNAVNGLTFSYDSGRVVDRLASGVAAQVAHVSRWAHARGMFLSANFNGSDARSSAWWGAHAIDYFGLERGLPEKAGPENDPYTTVDGFALYKRVLAGRRPISTIDPDCDSYSPSEVERRFHQTILYGIYMGCGGGSSWPEEHRPVFAAYTPLLRAISAAGWEVVTAARSSNPVLLLERFGSVAGDGATWVAVHNPTGTPQPYEVTVEPGPLGGRGAGELEAQDRITGSAVPLVAAAGGTRFTGTLPASTTALVRLRPSG